jgi:uncharacterized protein YcbX
VAGLALPAIDGLVGQAAIGHGGGMMQLAGLFTYPVKSLRGHALDAATLEPCGLAGDRRWMLVDPDGRFITRRQVPAMAAMAVTPVPDGLILHHPDHGSYRVVTPDADAPVIEGRVWKDVLPVRLGNPQADDFLATALGRPARLAWQHDPRLRPVKPGYARPGEHVSLADGFPLLVVTEGSLAALNERLAVTVPMARFRPNLVIAGAEPWAEDRWRRIRIGEVELRLTRPCARCIVVTQQPDTGERLEGNEPLTTLRAMGHATADGIMFGQNAVPERLGRVRICDPVEVLATGEPLG